MWCSEAEWVLGFSLKVDVWINNWMNSIQCCILQGFLRGLLCSRLLYCKSIFLNSLLSGNTCLYNIQGEYPCITSPQKDWWEQQRHNYEGKVGLNMCTGRERRDMSPYPCSSQSCSSTIFKNPAEPLKGCAILSDTAWGPSLLYLSIQTYRQAVKYHLT